MPIIILIILVVIGIVGIGAYHLRKNASFPRNPPGPLSAIYTSQAECERVTQCGCGFVSCDYNCENGRSFKGWECYEQTTSTKISLPVITLKTGFGMDGIPTPWYPSSIPVVIPPSLADKIAAYGEAGYVFLGPKGWTGEGLVGADGNTSINLYPSSDLSEKAPGVSIFIASTGTGVALDEATPYFSWVQMHWQELGRGFPLGPSPAGIQINPISPHLVRFSFPNTPEGLERYGIAFSNAQDHQKDMMWAFERITVNLPSSQRDLGNFLIEWYSKDRKLNEK